MPVKSSAAGSSRTHEQRQRARARTRAARSGRAGARPRPRPWPRPPAPSRRQARTRARARVSSAPARTAAACLPRTRGEGAKSVSLKRQNSEYFERLSSRSCAPASRYGATSPRPERAAAEHVPRPVASRPGRGDEAGEELGLKPGARGRAPRAAAGPTSRASRAEDDQQHAERLVVPAAGDLDERERAPGQDEQPLQGQAAARQHESEERRGSRARSTTRKAFIAVIESWTDTTRARGELPERRVDRGVVLVVEAVVDGVAEGHPLRRVGPVGPAVRVPAVDLDAAFPHVAVDVVAEERRRGDEGRAPGEREGEAAQEPAPRQAARRPTSATR